MGHGLVLSIVQVHALDLAPDRVQGLIRPAPDLPDLTTAQARPAQARARSGPGRTQVQAQLAPKTRTRPDHDPFWSDQSIRGPPTGEQVNAGENLAVHPSFT